MSNEVDEFMALEVELLNANSVRGWRKRTQLGGGWQ